MGKVPLKVWQNLSAMFSITKAGGQRISEDVRCQGSSPLPRSRLGKPGNPKGDSCPPVSTFTLTSDEGLLKSLKLFRPSKLKGSQMVPSWFATYPLVHEDGTHQDIPFNPKPEPFCEVPCLMGLRLDSQCRPRIKPIQLLGRCPSKVI